MSQIDSLIQQHCPNGVEHLPLGEVGEFTRGSGMQKADLADSGVPAIHYGQIHTHYGIWAESTLSFVSEDLAARLRMAQPGDLVIATTSEDDEAVGKASAWLGKEPAAVSGDAFIFTHRLDPKFVSYFFHGSDFQSQKMRYITGAKVRRVSGANLAKIRIPVPPLEVQQEIVRILDKFTLLEAELEAELEARRKQYEHYQHKVINEAASQGSARSLGSLGQIITGRTPKAADTELWGGAIDFITPSDIKDGMRSVIQTARTLSEKGLESVRRSLIPARSILVTCIGADMGKTVINHEECVTNQQINSIILDEDVLPEYLFHVLTAMRPTLLRQGEQNGATLPIINKTNFSKIEVSIPSMDIQRSSAKKLDFFDTLTNDLSFGLPAEIEARRQQYEYYRDKLLTFKELVA